MGDLAEIGAAYRHGRLLGASLEGWAGLCPYDQSEQHLRRAWMAGFSDGRAERANTAPSVLRLPAGAR